MILLWKFWLVLKFVRDGYNVWECKVGRDNLLKYYYMWGVLGYLKACVRNGFHVWGLLNCLRECVREGYYVREVSTILREFVKDSTLF